MGPMCCQAISYFRAKLTASVTGCILISVMKVCLGNVYSYELHQHHKGLVLPNVYV